MKSPDYRVDIEPDGRIVEYSDPTDKLMIENHYNNHYDYIQGLPQYSDTTIFEPNGVSGHVSHSVGITEPSYTYAV